MKFKKLRGTHNRKEGRVLKTYKSGDVIEVESDEELRIHDPNLATWQLIEDKTEPATAATPTKTSRFSRTKTTMVVEEREEKDGYNVRNVKSGKIINDDPLTMEEAKTLIEDATEPQQK